MSDFDELIEHLLSDIALCGNHGLTTLQLESAITAFFAERQNLVPAVQTGPTAADPLFAEAPPQQTLVDNNILESVHDWLKSHPDVRIENDRHLEIDDDNVNPDAAEPGTTEETIKSKHARKRFFTTEERMWQAITGHGVDHKRVPAREFELLCIIAAHGSRGVLQPAVTKLTGQDKRSVPKRTDMLAEKGYIIKEHVTGSGIRTSLLKLKRYASEPSAPTTSASGNEHSNLIYYDAWFETTVRLLKGNDNILALNDLRVHLGIDSKRQEVRLLWRCIRRLIESGCLQRVSARYQDREGQDLNVRGTHIPRFAQAIQLLREPTEYDRVKFRQTDVKDKALDTDDWPQAEDEREHEDDADGEDGIAVSDDENRQADGDDEPDDLELLRARAPPAWTPTLPITNQIYRIVDNAGTNGIDATDLAAQLSGSLFRRPLDEATSRLTDVWKHSQPPHLNHLTIVRDTVVRRKVALSRYRTVSNARLVTRAEAVGAGFDESEIMAQNIQHSKLDKWGFPKIPSKELLSTKDGVATGTQKQKQAKKIPPRIERHALASGRRAKKTSSLNNAGNAGGIPANVSATNTPLPRRISDRKQPRRGTQTECVLSGDQVQTETDQIDPGVLSTGLSNAVKSSPNGKRNRAEEEHEAYERAAQVEAERRVRIELEKSMRQAAVSTIAQTVCDVSSEKPDSSSKSNAARFDVLPQDRVAQVKADLMARTKPGVYINPPGAQALKRDSVSRPVRGRPRSSLIAVIKSPQLRRLQWYREGSQASAPGLTGLEGPVTKDYLEGPPHKKHRFEDTPQRTVVDSSTNTSLFSPTAVSAGQIIRRTATVESRPMEITALAPTVVGNTLTSRPESIIAQQTSDVDHIGRTESYPVGLAQTDRTAPTFRLWEDSAATAKPLPEIQQSDPILSQDRAQGQPIKFGTFVSPLPSTIADSITAVSSPGLMTGHWADRTSSSFAVQPSTPGVAIPMTSTTAASDGNPATNGQSLIGNDNLQLNSGLTDMVSASMNENGHSAAAFGAPDNKSTASRASRNPGIAERLPSVLRSSTVDDEAVHHRNLLSAAAELKTLRSRPGRKSNATWKKIAELEELIRKGREGQNGRNSSSLQNVSDLVPTAASFEAVRSSLSEGTQQLFDKAYVLAHADEEFHHRGNGLYARGPRTTRPRMRGTDAEAAAAQVARNAAKSAFPGALQTSQDSVTSISTSTAVEDVIADAFVNNRDIHDNKDRDETADQTINGRTNLTRTDVTHHSSDDRGATGLTAARSDPQDSTQSYIASHDGVANVLSPSHKGTSQNGLSIVRPYTEGLAAQSAWPSSIGAIGKGLLSTKQLAHLPSNHSEAAPGSETSLPANTTDGDAFANNDTMDVDDAMDDTSNRQNALVGKRVTSLVSLHDTEPSVSGTVKSGLLKQRQRIILNGVHACKGVFPGNAEPWHLSVTAWQRLRNQTPDRHTVDNVLKSLLEANLLKKFAFNFRSKNGVEIRRFILTEPGIPPDSELVTSLQKKIIDCHPAPYLPPEVDFGPNIKGKFAKSRSALTQEGLSRVAKEFVVRRITDHGVQQTSRAPVAEDATAKQLGSMDAATTQRRRKNKRPINSDDEEDNIDGINQDTATHEHVASSAQPLLAGRKGVSKKVRFEGSRVHNPTMPAKRMFGTAANRLNRPISAIRSSKAFRRSRDVEGGMTLDDIARHRRQSCSLLLHPEQTLHPATGTFGTSGIVQLEDAPEQRTLRSRSLQDPFYSPNGSLVQEASTEWFTSERLGSDQETDDIVEQVPGSPPTPSRHSRLEGPDLESENPVHAPEVPRPSGKQRRPYRTRVKNATEPVGDPVLESDDDFVPDAASLGAPTVPSETTGVKRAITGRDRKSPAMFKDADRLVVAMALVNAVCGGINQDRISWTLIAHALSFRYEGEFLRRRWPTIRKQRKPDVERLRDALRQPFLIAYENDELPALDFSNLNNTDWPTMFNWAEHVVGTLKSKDGPETPQLYENRKASEQHYAFTEHGRVFELPWDEYFSCPTDMTRRHLALRFHHGLALPDQAKPSDQLRDDYLLAKSWIRAVSMTRVPNYNKDLAKLKIEQLGAEVVAKVSADLLTTKMFLQEKKNRHLPGRNYDIHHEVLIPFRRWPAKPREHKYLRSVAQAWMDINSILETRDELSLIPAAHDQSYLVLTNLVAQGMLKVESVLPGIQHDFDAPYPRISPWGYGPPGYETKKVNTSVLKFPMVYTKTARYKSQHGLKPGVVIPLQPDTIPGEIGPRIPFWVDIHGNLIDDVWDMVLRSMLHLIVFRPGCTAMYIEKAHSSRFWAWEIEMVLEWMGQVGIAQRCGAGKEVGGGVWKGGWRAGEWWYCAFTPEIATWKAPLDSDVGGQKRAD